MADEGGVSVSSLAGLRRLRPLRLLRSSQGFQASVGGAEGVGRPSEATPILPYMVARRERKKFGGRGAMARAAFIFSLNNLCTTLAETKRYVNR